MCVCVCVFVCVCVCAHACVHAWAHMHGQGSRGEEKKIIEGKEERSTEGQEFEQRCVAMGNGELRIATSKSQMPGKQEATRTKQG